MSVFLQFFAQNICAKLYLYPADLKFYPTQLTQNYEPVVFLSGIWTNSLGEIFRVPFVDDENTEITIFRDFELKSVDFDSLYLYFEGIAWNSEVYLNSRLIGLNKNPFQEWMIGLPKDLFKVGKNTLQVKMKSGETSTKFFYNLSLNGIHKPVYLLKKSENYFHQISFNYTTSDSVLIIFPFHNQFLFNISIEKFDSILTDINSKGFNKIYFPMPISARLKDYLHKFDINLVVQINEKTKLAAYQSYSNLDYQTANIPFWYDENAKPTKNVSKFFIQNKGTVVNESVDYTVELVIIEIFLLILLVTFKILDPELFSRMMRLSLILKNEWVLIKEDKFIRGNVFFLAIFFRILCQVLSIFLFLEYLKNHSNFEYINIINEPSLFYKFSLYTSDMFWGKLFLIFLLVFGWFIFRIMLTIFFSKVYNLKEFTDKISSIEIATEMPFVFYLQAFGFMVLIAKVAFLPYIWAFCMFLFLIRKYLYFFVGMNSVLKMQYSVIILYLCNVEILPWILII